MMQQLEIDWNNVVHGNENNRHSEQILFDQYERLSKNCKTLYNAFKRGERLTGMDIVSRYSMMEYRKRIQEINHALKAAGHPGLQEETLSNGAKKWWL